MFTVGVGDGASVAESMDSELILIIFEISANIYT